MPRDDGNGLEALAARLRGYDGRELRVMEVCGTHTHENYRLGLRCLLPGSIRLIAGPGCPVCVTPAGFIDKAVWLARQGRIVCSFGDLIRVPGGGASLAVARAQGADVRVCYSPLDAVETARQNPGWQVVFLAVGFETTVPAACLAVKKARREGLKNFSLLTACKTMENAYYLLRDAADAFLYPGHVSAITGMGVYRRLALAGISGAVAGFTAPELMTALVYITEKSRSRAPFAANCYTRVVAEEGNPAALALMEEMLEPCAAEWRGLGLIEGSGLRLREEYAGFDAQARFCPPESAAEEPAGCCCGQVLRGALEPPGCPLFGTACTPENPVGACMVSTEGACAAHYKYGGLKLDR